MANITPLQASFNVILGADAVFPLSGDFAAIQGIPLLIQDIEQLLLTLPGERVWRPNWGCGLRSLIWENQDFAAVQGQGAIQSALENYEPRITVNSVDVNSNPNTGLITYNIQFVINQSNTSISLIFPFRTGTDLSQA